MKAQGSLEYMVIIAVVLAISGIAILYTSGIVGTQTSVASISYCKQTAEKCELSKMTSPTDPCSSCITACIDKNKVISECDTKKYYDEITPGAVPCCQKGMSDNIYAGSTGCGKTVIHIAGSAWTKFNVPYDWESTTSSELCAKYSSSQLFFLVYFGTAKHDYSYMCGDPHYYDFTICPGLGDLWVWSYQAFDMVN